MDHDDLARKAMGNIVKFMLIKWTIVLVAAKVAKRVAKKAS